jgi:DNA-binding CsgD family transcriptional regulator
MVRELALGARRYLRASRGFPRGLQAAALDVALNAYPGEAYLVRPGGRVEFANTAGAERLNHDARTVLEELARATRGDASGFCVRPVRAQGIGALFLAMRTAAPQPQLDARLDHARRVWRLTPRELQVLRRLAHGDANKDIAERLDLSVRTVEVHVNALMVKARADSRLRLIALLWQGA